MPSRHRRASGREVQRAIDRFIVSLETMLIARLGLNDTRGLDCPMPVPESAVRQWLSALQPPTVVGRDDGIVCSNPETGVLLAKLRRMIALVEQLIERLGHTHGCGGLRAELEQPLAQMKLDFRTLWDRRFSSEQDPQHDEFEDRTEMMRMMAITVAVESLGMDL